MILCPYTPTEKVVAFVQAPIAAAMWLCGFLLTMVRRGLYRAERGPYNIRKRLAMQKILSCEP